MNNVTDNADFCLLKASVQSWCSSFALANMLEARELDGDLWIVARKDDTSMDLKARRDMNVYLAEAPRRKKQEYMGRLYVSEMPGASVIIKKSPDGSGWLYSASEDKAKSGQKTAEQKSEQRWAYGGSLPDRDAPLDEATFVKLFCDWIAAYYSMKSVYYYA
ncbi:hypothetical protein LJC48_04205 [Desulfovibrio sp. OttesenSCG-928-C06]|nr:hypothetical protein [Desulfovibrio sp. OttesenSCG-928-C06]